MTTPLPEHVTDEELDEVVIAIQALTPHQPDAATHDLGSIDQGREILREKLTGWISRRDPVQPAEGEVAELVNDLQRFITEYSKMRGLHPEHIYSIQEGIEGRESHLTISQLTRIAVLLQHSQPEQSAIPLTSQQAASLSRGLEQARNMEFVDPPVSPEQAGEVTDEEIDDAWEVACGASVEPEDFREFARAAIALDRSRSQPVQPADGEVAELVGWLSGMYWAHPDKGRAARTIELLAQLVRPVHPVPVGERPILKRDPFNDAEGRCWCGTGEFIDETGYFPVAYPASWELRAPCQQDVCFLAHDALPSPEKKS